MEYPFIFPIHTAELALLDDGTARYVVTWFNDEATEVLQQYAEDGRWSRRGNMVMVTLPPPDATLVAGRIEYTYSPCLSHRSFGGNGCSPGLTITATNMPNGYNWELWSFIKDEVQ